MKNVINNFIQQINTNGISQSDVRLLEDTLGEKVISSNVNIKSFTTERSGLGLCEAIECLEHYVPDTTSDKKVFSTEEVFNIRNAFITSLNELSSTLADIVKVYNEDKKNTLFNLKHRWTWNSVDGNVNTEVYDMFSKKYSMGQILMNSEMIREACHENSVSNIENKISDFLSKLERNQENKYINWEIGGYDTFIIMGLLINKEFDSYLYQMNFTPMRFSGEDLINFLDNAYVHYEYALSTFKIQKDTYVSNFNRSFTVNSAYTCFANADTLERVEFLIEKNKIFVEFLRIIREIFNSMSNL